MANPLQRASTIRKVIYFGVILALFTLTLFWRGSDTFRLPASNPGQPLNVVQRYTILPQAKELELREMEQGDPDLFGSAALVALPGFRGLVVTALWKAAIEKQKKNEFSEFETYVRLVTKLQPNFRVPWLFQSWNIAYNVSVENERLNDMYFYIARGIELLAEGERLNKKSPDMRHNIAFYYQNKFGVSDKVTTLRSLMQVSCIPPEDRKPDRFIKPDKSIDTVEFEKFCAANPQLVRRLREKLNCNVPQQVVQFLADNSEIPSRFVIKKDEKNYGELNTPELQYPILPKQFTFGGDEKDDSGEYHPFSNDFDDRFDAFHAARAWSRYAQVDLPPPPKDELGQPLPTGYIDLQGDDRKKYRIPKSPALIIFRSGTARAQSYLAERLMKEGWFDEKTSWKPDNLRDSSSQWFKSKPDLGFTASDSSIRQWQKAFELWNTYGRENALELTQSRMQMMSELASRVDPQNEVMGMSREQLARVNFDYQIVEARKAMTALEQNIRITNYPRFISQSQAEMQPLTIEARKLFADAQVQQSQAEYQKALPIYVQAMNLWRQVMINHPKYHRGDQAREGEEEMYEYLMKMADLQMKELEIGEGKKRFEQFTQTALAGLGGMAGNDSQADLKRSFAEDEVLTKITELEEKVQQKIQDISTAIDGAMSPIVIQADSQTRNTPIKSMIGRSIVNTDFSWLKLYKEKNNANEPWVSESTIELIRTRLNLVRKLPVANPTEDQPNPPR